MDDLLIAIDSERRLERVELRLVAVEIGTLSQQHARLAAVLERQQLPTAPGSERQRAVTPV